MSNTIHYSRQLHNTNYKTEDIWGRVLRTRLLSCDTVQTCRLTPITCRHLLPPSSWLQWVGFQVARLYKVTYINKGAQVGKVFQSEAALLHTGYSLCSSWSELDLFYPLPGVWKDTNFLSTLVGQHPALHTVTLTMETASLSETLVFHIKPRRWSEKKCVFDQETKELTPFETKNSINGKI